MASVPSEQELVNHPEAQAALPAPEPHKALPPPAPDAPKAAKGSLVRKLIVVLVILLAIAFVVYKVKANQKAQDAETEKLAAAADRPIPVQVAPVQQKSMPIYLTALGTVTAYNMVTVRSRVDGQLMRVNFREGQAVRKGQLLAEIDPRPYQAALAQAEGQLAKDQANAKNADAEAARYTALYQAGVVSKESQQSQVSTAGQATGSIQADVAAIAAAKVNVVYTKITSPIDGVVGLRQVDPGNIVHAADTTGLVLVTQLQPISVIFTLPEDYLPQVLQATRAGRSLPVEAFDRSETTHLATGSLLTLDNQIDTTTGTDKVKAVFDNHENTLFPNQFVNVRLILQQRPNSLVIPSVAVQTGTQGSFVYVVREGDPPQALQDANSASRNGGKGRKPQTDEERSKAATENRQQGPSHYVLMAPIKIDLTEGTQVIVGSGLQAGDQLVIDGTERLKNGSRVTLHKAPASSTAAASQPADSTAATANNAPSGQNSSNAQDDQSKSNQQGNRGQRP